MMIEIVQMTLSYFLNKLLKDCFLKRGRNDPESAELVAPSAGQLKVFKSFKAPNVSRISAETRVTTWLTIDLLRDSRCDFAGHM